MGYIIPSAEERVECRALRKLRSDTEKIREGLFAHKKILELVESGKAKIPPGKMLPQIPFGAFDEVNNYLFRINETYIKLGCKEHRIELLKGRISDIRRLAKEGKGTPESLMSKERYQKEIDWMEGGKFVKELLTP